MDIYRFWDTFIEPVLKKLQPAGIVEIGCEFGKNTRNLVEFCVKHGATLYAIDPEPKFDVATWEQHYGDCFVFYRSLSLNAIPLVDRFDVLLIDGDHNWYTVFNELKLIEKRCWELEQSFPLIMLHDVGWPYGRRDLYYNPQNIPEAYRKPYAKKGVRPGFPELVDDGGLNPHLFNSLYENNYQSGVLTAVGDFIKDTEQNLEFIYIPGHHGLGILFPVRLKENKELAEFINAFSISPVMIKHVENIEASRVNAEIKKLEQRATLQMKEVEVSDLREQLSVWERMLTEMREQVAGFEEEREAQQEETECLREELEQQVTALRAKEAEVLDLREQLSVSERTLTVIREQVAGLEKEREEHQEEAERLREGLEQQQAALQAQEAEVAEFRQRLDDKERAMAEKDQQLQKEKNARQKEIKHLQENLQEQVSFLNNKIAEIQKELSYKDALLVPVRKA